MKKETNGCKTGILGGFFIMILFLFVVVQTCASCATGRSGYGLPTTQGSVGYQPFKSTIKVHKHACRQRSGY